VRSDASLFAALKGDGKSRPSGNRLRSLAHELGGADIILEWIMALSSVIDIIVDHKFFLR
jgi:hypothetical protein